MPHDALLDYLKEVEKRYRLYGDLFQGVSNRHLFSRLYWRGIRELVFKVENLTAF